MAFTGVTGRRYLLRRCGVLISTMTKNLIDSRNEVVDRMTQEAQARGADAVLAFRFDTSEMGQNWTEICAYGTAVKIQRR